jgi:hypothetical protein
MDFLIISWVRLAHEHCTWHMETKRLIAESDTYLHAWEQMAIILQDKSIHGIICDIGLPVMHRNNRFNCRVSYNGADLKCTTIILNRQTILTTHPGRYSRWQNLVQYVLQIDLHHNVMLMLSSPSQYDPSHHQRSYCR